MSHQSILVICTSPNETSVSRVVAEYVSQTLTLENNTVAIRDAKDLPPAWIVKGGVDQLPSAWQDLYSLASEADAVVIVSPIYYYSAGSPTRAIVEALGETLSWKPVLLLCAAGSLRSHTALGSLMESLIYERNSFVFPNSVLTTAGDLVDGKQPSNEISARLKTVCEGFSQYSLRLRNFSA